jgi:uncharacterized tellurite resistance protein B-like protein
MRDRINAICELMLGAAYADDHFHDREKQAIRKLLGELVEGDELPPAVIQRIETFDPTAFDPAKQADEFASDSTEDKRKLIDLVAAVHDADEVLDLAEDAYLRKVASALGLPDDSLGGTTLEYEIEDLRKHLDALRAGPPPVPGTAEVTVDLDD